MSEAVSLVVEGRVQRVGFRRFAESLARKHKLAGFVQNLKDGSVKLFVQGNNDSIVEFTDEIQKAELPIVIDSVITKKAKSNPTVKFFSIRSSSLTDEIQEGFGAMESQFTDYRSEFGDYRQEFSIIRR